MKKIELLAPAGDLEKLKTAIIYGADAVYIGGEKLGLRVASKNFDDAQMKEGIEFAHQRGKKVYITCNITAHNDDLDGVDEYFKNLEELGADALIISDPAFVQIAKESVPNMQLHLSTQANTTNYMTAKFWQSQGISRIVAARELSIQELAKIKEKCPDLELEMFVHGAMCMSYSGRCLISNFMTGRDANKGECAQPCRWNYSLMEEKRPGEYFPVEQDERGTYFFNSKDLCLIGNVKEIIEAGIDSMKIEGRVKTAYYVATVVRAYKMAIDAYYKDPQNYKFDEKWLEDVSKASHRNFTDGFFHKEQTNDTVNLQNYSTSSYIRTYDVVAIVKDFDEQKNMAKVVQKNKFLKGDEVEIIGPNFATQKAIINKIISEKGEQLEQSNVPMQEVFIDVGMKIDKDFMIIKQL